MAGKVNHEVPAVSKTPSIMDRCSKVLKWFEFHNGNLFSDCPHCSIQLTEADMVRHLEQCPQVTYTVTRPDGFMLSVTYAGPNGGIKALLKQGIVYNNNNLEYHYQKRD